MAMKSWAWRAELNSYTQSTLRLLAKRFFLPRRQIILRPQNQESQRTKVDIRKNQSAFKNYYPGVHQTKQTYDSRATKSWAWTTELNSYAQITLRFPDKRVFLQRSKFIPRPQIQESLRPKLNEMKKYSAFKTYYRRVYQTKKRPMTLGPRNLEHGQLNWTHMHRLL